MAYPVDLDKNWNGLLLPDRTMPSTIAGWSRNVPYPSSLPTLFCTKSNGYPKLDAPPYLLVFWGENSAPIPSFLGNFAFGEALVEGEYQTEKAFYKLFGAQDAEEYKARRLTRSLGGLVFDIYFEQNYWEEDGEYYLSCIIVEVDNNG
jgi:hypothetical protein